MKQLLFLIMCSICLMSVGYSQNSIIDKGVIDLKRSILKNIVIDDSIIQGKKSAIVLTNIKLNKTGKFLSCVLMYNTSGKVGQCVIKAISSVSIDVWKKLKGIENISIPVFFVYDDGESEFCMNWLDINLKKMETNYLLGLSMKPIVVLLSESKRIK